MKRLLLVILSIILLSTAVIISCAKPEPSPTPTPSPSPAPAPASAEPMVLKWTSHEPDAPGSTQNALKEFAKRIDEGTQGRVKIEIFFGSVLGKPTDFVKMVGGSGVADGGYIITTYTQWETPLWSASQLPGMFTSYKTGPLALWDLYNEWPLMQEEWEKVNMKPLWCHSPHMHWIGYSKPLNSLADYKGKKFWATSLWPAMVESFGITNVMMTAPESYEAWQKSTIDGVWGMPKHTFRIFKYTELGKYMTPLGDFAGGCPINPHAINLDVWNKISPEDQQTILKISDEMVQWQIDALDAESIALDEYFKEQGINIVEFSDQDQKQILDACPLVVDDWLATAESKGIPGEEFIQRFKEKLKNYQ